MDSNIILSIVVPVYNVEKFLDICLESIIKNYKKGIEIVLIDDGSTDNSSEICDKYSNKYEYINVVHKKNGGLSSARNSGIQQARGKYIWFVDSDDYIKDGSLNRIISLILKDVDLIIGSYSSVLPDGTINEEYLNNPKNYEKYPYEYFYNIGSASYAAVKFIVKRKLIIEKNLFFTEGIYHEDEEWSPRVLCNAKTFVVINEPIYNYRVGNPESIMGMKKPKKVYDKLFICKSIYDRIKGENLKGNMSEFLKYRIEHNFVTALNEVPLYDGEDKNKMMTEIKNNIYLIDDIKSKKVKAIKIALSILGVNNTSKLLRLRNRIK